MAASELNALKISHNLPEAEPNQWDLSEKCSCSASSSTKLNLLTPQQNSDLKATSNCELASNLLALWAIEWATEEFVGNSNNASLAFVDVLRIEIARYVHELASL
ncbi:hypothetical protein ACJ72_01886 [Emergomyces africanus]|uniref:Uncharacterized protein n=1 Tax=Emergomyces africanus TaxID=1955775 RepID=A0A1B7P421_9EURO|nr:hypothetical protein ACJ72_01886 [Emergomyces africanus]